MLTLSAKIRKTLGKKVKALRQQGILPAVLYGPKMKKAQPLKVEEKQFEKVFKQAGESSLISLQVENEKMMVLVQEVAKHPLTRKPIHVDFYQPRLEEEIEVTVPLIFKGQAPAVKELGGTLVKNISELEIKALPHNLLRQIEIDIGKLKTFEDAILVKDLKVPKEVKILREAEEIVAKVSRPEKVEEELVKPIEEKAEEVEKAEETGTSSPS